MKRLELIIDEEINSELNFISLVEDPAIEIDFFYFGKHDNALNFKMASQEKRIVTGPAMIADLDIIRLDEFGNQFMVFFSKETVRKAAELFFKQNNQNTTNINHEGDALNGVTVFESWIVDNENGKSGGKNFEDIADGTWMISYKVESDEIWNDFIKTGKVKGFSIQGDKFGIKEAVDLNEEELFSLIEGIAMEGKNETEIYDEIQELINKTKQK